MRWDLLLRGATANDEEYVCEQVRVQHGLETLFDSALGRLPVVDAVLSPVGALDSSFVRIFRGGRSRCSRITCRCGRHRLPLRIDLFDRGAEVEKSLRSDRRVGGRRNRDDRRALLGGQGLVRSHSRPGGAQRRVVTEDNVRVRSPLAPMRLQVGLRQISYRGHLGRNIGRATLHRKTCLEI